MEEFTFDLVTPSDFEAVCALEAISYPPDEAATPAKIQYRIENANPFFCVLKRKDSGNIIGFVNGTCTTENVIFHESMSHHVAGGRSLVIHSVTVDPNFRRQGIATNMLKMYIRKIGEYETISRILLLTKDNNILLYLKVGFQFLRISPVVHGQVTLPSLFLTFTYSFLSC